ADRLRQEIWQAADPQGWTRCLLDPTARMDPTVIVQNHQAVTRHLQAVSLLPPGSDPSMHLLSIIKIAAARAAERWKEDQSGNDPNRWITVSDAARITGCSKGVISRAVDAKELSGNGQSGRERRIDAVDLARWQLARVNKPEPSESDEAVER